MDTQPNVGEPQAPQDPSATDGMLEPVELMQRAYVAACNFQWGPAQELKDLAQAKAKALQGRPGELIRGLVDAGAGSIEGFAVPIRDTDPDRFRRAGEHLDGARDLLKALCVRFPAETGIAEFQKVIKSVDFQCIWQARSMANKANDQRQILIADGQVNAFLDGLSPELKAEFGGIIAVLQWNEITKRIKIGTDALSIMDLRRALNVISAARADLKVTLPVIQKSFGPEVIFQSLEKIMTGAAEYFEALEAYTRALHDAVIGDVATLHVDQLTKAEDLLRAGASKMQQGIVVMDKFDAQAAQNVLTALERPLPLIQNLRILCELSLQPRSWMGWASIKFVVLFLVTAAVLMGISAATHALDGLSGGVATISIVLVSFVAGLIGGFGFEALRFLPIIEQVFKLRPSAEQSAARSPEN